MDVVYLLAGVVGIIALPRLTIAVILFSIGGYVASALAIFAMWRFPDDMPKDIDSFFRNVRDGFRAAGRGLLREIGERLTLAVNMLSFVIHGRPFIIVEVVELVEEVEIEVEVEKPVSVRRVQFSVRDMSERDARLCLGVADDAGPDQVSARYRQILQAVHPDHGGSMLLAAIVNRAKTVLAPKKRLT